MIAASRHLIASRSRNDQYGCWVYYSEEMSPGRQIATPLVYAPVIKCSASVDILLSAFARGLIKSAYMEGSFTCLHGEEWTTTQTMEMIGRLLLSGNCPA